MFRNIPDHIGAALVAVTLAYGKAGFLNTEPDADVAPYLTTVKEEAPALLDSLMPFLDELRSGRFPEAPDALPPDIQDRLNSIVAAIQQIKASNPGLDKQENDQPLNEEETHQLSFAGPLSAKQFLLETKNYWGVDEILAQPAMFLASGEKKLAYQTLVAQYEIANEEYGLHNEKTIAVVHALGIFLEHVGKYDEAEVLYREVLNAANASLPAESAYRIRYMAKLGSLLVLRGRYPEADGLLKNAVDDSTRFFGENHQFTANYLVDLAALRIILAEYKEADSLLKLALHCYHSKGMELSEGVARAQHKIAELMFACGCLQQAHAMIGLSTLSMSQFDRGNVILADILSTSGEIKLACGEIEGAESDVQMAMKINQTMRDASHPEMGRNRAILAKVLVRKGALDEAKSLLDRAASSIEMSLGPNHIDLAAIHMAQGELALELKQYVEAEAHLKKGLLICKKALGSEHPRTAFVRTGLALVLQETGQFARAEVLFRNALSVIENRLGESHPLVALHSRRLAGLLDLTARTAEANQLRLRADQVDRVPPKYDIGSSKEALFQNLEPLKALHNRGRFANEGIVGNHKHLAILDEGSEVWNKWRWDNPDIQPDLSGLDLRHRDVTKMNLVGVKLCNANMSGVHLPFIDFSKADLRGANLIGSTLIHANLQEANIEGTFFMWANLNGANLVSSRGDLETKLIAANLSQANLSGSNLRNVNLAEANLSGATLTGADLTGANLRGAILVGADLTRATLVDCNVFGVSAWNVRCDEATISNLTITDRNEPTITVDNLKVAQFIYLLLNNTDIRDVIDTIGKKTVLILGRFTPERKVILDAIRVELRKHDYLPIMFDFQKPTNRSYRETVSTLAHMARFVIADITSAKVILQELQIITPNLTSVPIQPILQNRARKNVVIDEDYGPYPWFLPTVHYRDGAALIAALAEKVIAPAEAKIIELRKRAS